MISDVCLAKYFYRFISVKTLRALDVTHLYSIYMNIFL